MTPREVADRLFESQKGVTPERVRKAQALASRSTISWPAVLSTMTDEERDKVRRVL